MVVRFLAGDVYGIHGRTVEIEVDLIGDTHRVVISGMAGKGIRESRERIRSAIVNSGYDYPLSRSIIINLAPATLEKDGAAFDLPIALGILLAHKQINKVGTEGWGVIGELSLDATVRPVPGVLGMMLSLRSFGARQVLVPNANLEEAQAVDGVTALGVSDLREAAGVITGLAPGRSSPGVVSPTAPEGPPPDLADVVGHRRVKRALALAVAGGHNVLLVGSPGSGKSFLAKRVGGLLAAPTREQQLAVTQIYSAAGMLGGRGLVTTRPFRAPHHTVSWAGLVGGGSIPRPGEITLAHHGVLFLDELPEYSRRALEALREPLEEGCVTISRSQGSVTFPARFLLVAAMNPCPCGYYMHPQKACSCSEGRVRRYLERISGPLLDRIDMRLEVRSTKSSELLKRRPPRQQSTRDLVGLVDRARRFRERRGQSQPNCELLWAQRAEWAQMSRTGFDLIAVSSEEGQLSTRALTRVLRLARTVADVDGVNQLEERHLQEALEFHSPRGGEGFFRFIAAM